MNWTRAGRLRLAARTPLGRRTFVGVLVGILGGATARLAAVDVAAKAAGKRIAKVARRYKGHSYVWGGNTPAGFDCSGFTQFVVRKALDIDIGQALPGQFRSGKRVKHGRWRTGDLVFFANTFERGLSHVGIYLGKGKFIHAENENTGVVISEIDSDYYAAHYHGARRLA